MAGSHDFNPTARSVAVSSRGPGHMAYLDFGPSERPVDAVFLHANGFNALTYRFILAPLAARYRILAVDQRGHGATTLGTATEGRRDWLDLRDDLLAFLRAVGLRHIVLTGHSMGATTGLLAAASEPSRCRGLALFDPVILPPGTASVATDSALIQAAARRRAIFPSREDVVKSYRGRGAFTGWPDAVLADYVEAGFRDLPGGEVVLACSPAWEASGYAAQGHDPWDAFSRVKCAINILRAEKSSTFPLASAGALGGKHIHISTVPGSTHFLPMERPDLVRSVLSATIEANLSAGAKTPVPA